MNRTRAWMINEPGRLPIFIDDRDKAQSYSFGEGVTIIEGDIVMGHNLFRTVEHVYRMGDDLQYIPMSTTVNLYDLTTGRNVKCYSKNYTK